ncbi:hypothetical protein WN944_025624 [Citrus x changshan-huyou]|uniref:Uncharacterized protein n=1 Tax=Citrus x changshan-huyou TaxID=2935761 RepID=A0AAP0QD48_9ROSI
MSACGDSRITHIWMNLENPGQVQPIPNTTSPPWPHFCASFKNGLDTKAEKSRKQLKETKNMAKKISGVKKTKALDAAKKK